LRAGAAKRSVMIEVATRILVGVIPFEMLMSIYAVVLPLQMLIFWKHFSGNYLSCLALPFQCINILARYHVACLLSFASNHTGCLLDYLAQLSKVYNVTSYTCASEDVQFTAVYRPMIW
jgi:hypothetical protein